MIRYCTIKIEDTEYKMMDLQLKNLFFEKDAEL